MADNQDTANPSARQALLALAERCEREGPSWRMCGDIEVAVFPGVTWWRGVGPFLCERGGKPFNPPPYVFSLDAAVTLVPEGWRWLARSDSDTASGFTPVARVSRPELDTKDHFYARASTVPLSLCAAALRARAGETA